MTEERHAALGIHHIDDSSPQQLVRRRQIVRRASLLVGVVLVAMAIGATGAPFFYMARALRRDSVSQEVDHA